MTTSPSLPPNRRWACSSISSTTGVSTSALQKELQRWLPFWNVQVQLWEGSKITMWYFKPTSKNIMARSKSAHPTQIRTGVVRNMFRTANKVSSWKNERKGSSLVLAHQIAAMNGYTFFGYQRKSTNNRSPPSISHFPLWRQNPVVKGGNVLSNSFHLGQFQQFYVLQ